MGSRSTSSVEGDGGSLHRHRQSIARVAPLDRAAERELAVRYREGDLRAGARLVEACLPFVVTIALDYRRWGVPLEDIVQQGSLGLLRAAAKFDPARECRLATYAAYWVRAEIREYVVRAFRVVRIGTTKAERRALRAYRRTRETDCAKLSELSGLPETRVHQLLPVISAREASLDAPGGEHLFGVEGHDATASPEAHVARRQGIALASTAVEEAVARLDDRERLIVRERMMAEDPTTLQDLGERLGVSKERVRQLETRARVKLRKELAALADVA